MLRSRGEVAPRVLLVNGVQAFGELEPEELESDDGGQDETEDRSERRESEDDRRARRRRFSRTHDACRRHRLIVTGAPP